MDVVQFLMAWLSILAESPNTANVYGKETDPCSSLNACLANPGAPSQFELLSKTKPYIKAKIRQLVLC